MKTIEHSSYGASTITKNLFERNGNLKWCVREKSKNINDNGWIFISDADNEASLALFESWCIVPFERVIEIEPAVLSLYELPVGTEVTMIIENGVRYFVDSATGKRL
jgi:hypothetical protein